VDDDQSDKLEPWDPSSWQWPVDNRTSYSDTDKLWTDGSNDWYENPPITTHDFRPARWLSELSQLIGRSRSILKLGDDWDGERGEGYAESTWYRATNFLLTLANAALERFQAPFAVPRISPAERGSIDLFWKQPGTQLLINIPADVEEPATYYGETSEGNTISGIINTATQRSDLIAWLILNR